MSQISNLTVVSSKHTVCVRKAAGKKIIHIRAENHILVIYWAEPRRRARWKGGILRRRSGPTSGKIIQHWCSWKYTYIWQRIKRRHNCTQLAYSAGCHMTEEAKHWLAKRVRQGFVIFDQARSWPPVQWKREHADSCWASGESAPSILSLYPTATLLIRHWKCGNPAATHTKKKCYNITVVVNRF